MSSVPRLRASVLAEVCVVLVLVLAASLAVDAIVGRRFELSRFYDLLSIVALVYAMHAVRAAGEAAR